MKNKKDEKWLDETISRAVDIGEVKFDAKQWKEKYILNKSEAAKHSTIKPHKNLWRFIMESKVTKYSAAAVVALAITLVLLSPLATPGNGGVVLADVQQKVADIETMIIRGTKTFTHSGENGNLFEFDGIKCEFDLVKYFSKEFGFVEEGYAENNLFYRITFNLPKQQTLIIFPLYKKYLTFTSTNEVAKIMEALATPDDFLSLLIENGYRKLGRDNIDGVEVEGFEFQGAGPIKEILPKFIADIQDYTGKIWIGVEKQLPVWIEGDLIIGKSLMTAFNDLNLHEVNILEKCDVELDESTFDTNPPEGYTEFTLSDILPLIPIEAKAGLVGLGVSSCIIPAGFIVWKKHRKKKTMANQH